MYRFPRLRNAAKSVLPERVGRAVKRAVSASLWFDLTQTSAEIERAASLIAKQDVARGREHPNELLHLGEKYMPSKIGHDYLRHYWLHFGPMRLQVKKLVEIGVE